MKSEISTRKFTQLLSATPRGARLARLLAVRQLEEWGWPPGGEVIESAALVVAELAANAVTHGRVQGRGFRLTLTAASATLRIEVTDSRGDRRPHPDHTLPPLTAETGRGLLLVEALTTRWGSDPCPPSGKLVWAEIDAQTDAPSHTSTPDDDYGSLTKGDRKARASGVSSR